ncbi:acetylornithine deacetylase [Marinobacter sp.]|uniref:acetylornithine deacetylase n=1 Tax=Marinobacter sp. TaxID=50741 RepID=UPI00384E09ED
MKKLVMTLVVLALVGYAGFKGSAWFLADKRLAEAREALADQGALLRGGLGSSIAGELIVHELNYHPHRLTQGIEARSVRFAAGSPLALVTSLLTPGDLPRQWRLEAGSLAMLLDTVMIRDWAAAGAEDQPDLFAPICGSGPSRKLGTGDLIRMGVTSLTGDASLRQEPDGLQAELNTATTGSLELSWPGARLDPTALSDIAQTTTEPMDIVLRDGGLMRKVAAWCAREAGIEVEAWADMVTRDFKAALRLRGYEPSQQLSALYRRWMTEGGRLELQVQPTAPALGMPIYSAVPPPSDQQGGAETGTADSPRGLAVRYNDAGVPGVYLTLAQVQSPSVASQGREPGMADEALADAPAWRPASPDQAPRWLEKPVKILLESGRVVEGRLNAVGQWRMDIARNVEGGEVSYPIRLDAIEKFEVWRRPTDAGRPMPPADRPEISAEDAGVEAEIWRETGGPPE